MNIFYMDSKTTRKKRFPIQIDKQTDRCWGEKLCIPSSLAIGSNPYKQAVEWFQARFRAHLGGHPDWPLDPLRCWVAPCRALGQVAAAPAPAYSAHPPFLASKPASWGLQGFLWVCFGFRVWFKIVCIHFNLFFCGKEPNLVSFPGSGSTCRQTLPTRTGTHARGS